MLALCLQKQLASFIVHFTSQVVNPVWSLLFQYTKCVTKDVRTYSVLKNCVLKNCTQLPGSNRLTPVNASCNATVS